MKRIEKVIYPMNTIKISQGQLYDGLNASHQNRHAWDLGGKYPSGGDKYEEAYAPCTCKLLHLDNGESNTALFGSCDKNGNPAEVMCADGKLRVLTFALTHCNNTHKNIIKFNHIYQTGELFYYEGGRSRGQDDLLDIHIHIEVAEGWQTEKKDNTEVWIDGISYIERQMPNTLDLQRIFFRLDGQDYEHNPILEGITEDNFPLTYSRYVEEADLANFIQKEKYHNIDITYAVLSKGIYNLTLRHAYSSFDDSIFYGQSLNGYCYSYDNSDFMAINGGPFLQNPVNEYLNIIGLLKTKGNSPIGSNGAINPIMGFKNGKLMEINYPINDQAELARFDWIRSCNKFVLIKNAQTVDENSNKEGYNSTVAHSAIGQKANGDYVLFCSKSGLSLSQVATFLLEKGCIIAFNLTDDKKSGMVVKNQYIMKNSDNEVDLFDAIIVTNKQYNDYFGELKMKVINEPIQVSTTVYYSDEDYAEETLTIQPNEVVKVTYLSEPYEGVQTGILIYQGKKCNFEYDITKMELFGKVLNQKYFIYFNLNNDENNPEPIIGNELLTNTPVNIPTREKINIIEVVKKENATYVIAAIENKLVEVEYDYPRAYISNHFEVSIAW